MIRKIKKPWGKVPHIFVLLFSLVLIASIATYLIPAGAYARIEDAATGQTLVVPGSFQHIQQSPVAPWRIPMLFVQTLVSKSVAELICFILIIGGSFEVVRATGCIQMLCRKAIGVFQSKPYLAVALIIILFSIPGFTMGMTTVGIVFVPITIATARALGFDDLIGMAMVIVGTNVGFAAGIFNPFSVGLAQTIAQLPLYSGGWIRWLLLFALLAAACIYTTRYANKTKVAVAPSTDPDLVPVLGIGEQKNAFTPVQGIVLGLFFCGLFLIAYGTSQWKWQIPHISVVFLLMGIVAGLIGRLDPDTLSETFVAGAKKMVKGACILGIAATMRAVLTQGGILDTVAFVLTDFTYRLPSWLRLPSLFYANAVLDLLVTSATAHATIAMPIMVPMGDSLGFTRSSVVFAFQLGDGLVNLTSPVSTTLTSTLAVSGVSYGRWLRFYLPLVGIYMAIGTGFIFLAAAVGY